MTEIAFYHLRHSSLDEVLPKLLEKTLSQGKRAVVLCGSAERAEALATLLWAYNPASWLPHGTAEDGEAAEQPVWLTARDENPNAAEYLFLVDGADSARLAEFGRCLDLFDGNDATAVEAARARWRARQAAGHAVTYWQQNDAGAWEQKA